MKQLKILMCSNRCFKDYPYLKGFTEEDWKVVRDPITDKCSKVTIERFFVQPVYAFLFAWFVTIPDAKQFCLDEFKKRNEKFENFNELMFKEMAGMAELAREHLAHIAS